MPPESYARMMVLLIGPKLSNCFPVIPASSQDRLERVNVAWAHLCIVFRFKSHRFNPCRISRAHWMKWYWTPTWVSFSARSTIPFAEVMAFWSIATNDVCCWLMMQSWTTGGGTKIPFVNSFVMGKLNVKFLYMSPQLNHSGDTWQIQTCYTIGK